MRQLLVALVLWLGVLAGNAFAAGKLALVIGNGDYVSAGRLANPVNDATDLSAALTRIGFEVTLRTNLDFQGVMTELRSFSARADGADMAVIYFAGHGLEVDQQNYLIPTDAGLRSARDVRLEAVPLDYLTDAVSGARGLRMVILDACRNNPFLAQMQRDNRSIGRGLSRTEPIGGTLVSYAAKAGTIAGDGDGRNSPFMAGLLAHIEEPGLDVSLMFRRVRDSVLRSTNNQQEPFTYGSLPGDEIYLVPPVVVAETPPAEPLVNLPANPDRTGTPEEEFAWGLVQSSTDPSQIQRFLYTFPTGLHVPEAIALLRKLNEAPLVATAPEPERGAIPIETPTLPETATSLPVPVPEPVTGPAETASLPEIVDPLAAPVPETPSGKPSLPFEGPELIMAIQTELTRLGCSPGGVDGDWGPKAQSAMRRFIARNDIRFLNVSKPTLYALNLMRAQAKSCDVASAPTTVTTESTPASVSIATPEAEATPTAGRTDSATNVSGCDAILGSWWHHTGHKAVALSADEEFCGSAWDMPSTPEAQRTAIALCVKRGGRGCSLKNSQ